MITGIASGAMASAIVPLQVAPRQPLTQGITLKLADRRTVGLSTSVLSATHSGSPLGPKAGDSITQYPKDVNTVGYNIIDHGVEN